MLSPRRKKGWHCGRRLENCEKMVVGRDELGYGKEKVLEAFKKGLVSGARTKRPNSRVISGLELVGSRDKHGEKEREE